MVGAATSLAGNEGATNKVLPDLILGVTLKGMKRFLPLILLVAFTASAFAAESADAIMAKAKTQAAKENKNILVKFSASWCGWCHRMSDWLKDTDGGKMVAGQYVVVTLIVDESDDHKSDENPGANEIRTKLGGDGVGIPFFAIVDKDGKMLANSNPNKDKKEPGNIGFPVENAEISHFMAMVKATSKLKAEQLAKVETSLKDNAKKIKGEG